MARGNPSMKPNIIVTRGPHRYDSIRVGDVELPLDHVLGWSHTANAQDLDEFVVRFTGRVIIIDVAPQDEPLP